MRSILTVVLLFATTSAYSRVDEWDHFIFSQEWPQTACLLGKLEHKQCLIPSYITSFVIHGLWPSEGNTLGPENCTGTPFDMNLIKNLTNELNHYWPNLYNNTEKDDFWRHEWSTHGTCAVSLEATGTEYLFFRKTLDLMKTYNITTFLNAGKIVPSDTNVYTAAAVESNLSSQLGHDVDLQCFYSKNFGADSKTGILSEVRICMDKKFNVISCKNPNTKLYFRSGKKAHTETCNGKIRFPEIKRS